MNYKYIDIHSHLDMAEEAGDLSGVLKRMHETGVGTITVGTDLKSSIEAVKIASENENVWACIGAHPEDDRTFIFKEEDFAELVKNPKVVAIGECGLDYFRLGQGLPLTRQGESLTEAIQEEKARQKREFIKQIEFSIKYNKPLMLHIRDAHEDAYEILKKYPKARGNLHFFTGSSETAKKFINLGYTISFPGVITFPPKADQPRADAEDAIRNIPLSMIHAETDSPFAAPIPYRGKKNEPAYVIEIVKKIAELRGEDEEKVRLQLLENARKVFGMSI